MITKIEQKCIGCKACQAICPVDAITIDRNNEGFEYPRVDDNKCIKCGKCMQFCPANSEKMIPKKYKTYAARCNDLSES